MISLDRKFDNPDDISEGYRIWKRHSDSTWRVDKALAGAGMLNLASGAWGAQNSKLKIEVADGTIKLYENDVERYSEDYGLSNYKCYISIWAWGVTGDLGTNHFDDLNLSCTNSLYGNLSLAREMARRQITTKEAWELYEARFTAEFEKEVASGDWTELGLLNADEIDRLVDDCDDETDWTTDATNSLSEEISDYREGSAALEAVGTAPLRFQNTKLRGPTGDEDNFDDNSLDTSYWAQLIVGTGSISEQNGRLECTSAAAADEVGVVTQAVHDLTASETCIDLSTGNNNRVRLLHIGLTKVTGSPPYNEDDWYQIYKDKTGSLLRVRKRKDGGTPTVLYSAAWTDPGGELRIRISGGTIYFYEDDNQRYSESYDFGSYNCYIYAYVYGDTGATGMDYFDDYVTSLSPVLDEQSFLQLFYYISDKTLVSGATFEVRLGNDASNYWQLERLWAGFDDDWQWVQFRFSDYTSKTGSPDFNELIKYFRLNLTGASISADLTDRIDFIRLFEENGDMYCRAEFETALDKGLNEARHVLWRLTAKGAT